MVKACKGYLTEDGLFRVWDQDRALVIKKIHDCLTLNRSYQDAFNRTQKQLQETPGERPFGFSKMYIFGKFEAFCRRLEKVSLRQKIMKNFFLPTVFHVDKIISQFVTSCFSYNLIPLLLQFYQRLTIDG